MKNPAERKPIVVEHNIPIPPPRQGIYPWKEMAAGDSFFLVDGRQMKRAMKFAQKFYKIKLISRKMDKGQRIWRVK